GRQLVFLGPVRDRGQIGWLYEHALASVSTSELETFGMTLLEAGAVGCPLIVTDLPAHREVAGDRARFVPVGGLKELAASMVEMRDDPPPRDSWHWPVSWDDSASQLASVMERLA